MYTRIRQAFESLQYPIRGQWNLETQKHESSHTLKQTPKLILFPQQKKRKLSVNEITEIDRFIAMAVDSSPRSLPSSSRRHRSRPAAAGQCQRNRQTVWST